ncbi:MAG: hypothetical protein LC108_07100 [Anaerolineales bacterium]|nr:hypothetical protein [Anaerolineales bacterium]
MKKLNTFLLFVFLLSSCAPAATAIPTLTPSPTKTATSTPTNTPTPTNTSNPTITPTPLPITFIYQDDVPVEARLLQEQAAYKAYSYFSQFVDLGSITIYTFSDIDLYIDEIYPSIQADAPTITKSWFIEDWKANGGSNTLAEDKVIIGSSYPAWKDDANRCFKVANVTHEIFHIVQSKLLQHPLFRPELDYGPEWIKEGSAQVMAYKFADGINQCDAQKLGFDYWRTDASVGDTLLSDLGGFDAIGKPKFWSVAPWAVDYLIQSNSHGEKSVIQYYSEIGNGKTWQAAFQSSFGMTIEEYYAEFDAIQKGQAIELDKSVCLPQTDNRVKCLGLFDNNGYADYIFEIPIDVSKIPSADQWKSTGNCIVTGWGGSPKSPTSYELAISFDSSTHGVCHIDVIFSADQQITLDFMIP